ncbi:Hypothetical protein PHPALM_17268 [Phytophthora palmivora]|uniref:Uncharacterized protein n=1 Tax=Phytophthora palmivora TaxID=4796 RepID=A0A2P4XMS8_9STRA|nr:Hypothetical protein PHPALM_17268 [Phytophthora palmivora]
MSDDRAADTPCLTEDPECILNAIYVYAMHEITVGLVLGHDAEDNNVSEHLANDIDITEYAQESAFLPDRTEITVTALDYTGPNVPNKDLHVGQQQKLVDVLKRHEKSMISSGNALPPPAYVIAIMEYAMPLVKDLLTDMEVYRWFCSLDAASGFSVIMMTQRARKILRFCALGHFEWLRMPFGLKNAPRIYQRMIDNALWGCGQPKGRWSQFVKEMQVAEEQTKDAKTIAAEDCERQSEAQPRPRTKFEADRESFIVMNAASLLVNSPTGDMFANGEPDNSSLVQVFDRSFVDDICCCNETFDGCLATLDRLLQRFTECRISVSFTKRIFVQSKVDFLSHEKGMQSFLGALNYYSRFIQDFAAYGAALYQFKDADFAPGGDLTVGKRSFAALHQKVMDGPILRRFNRDKAVQVMLYANELNSHARTQRQCHPIRFCGRVLKDAEMNYHPAEKEILALLLLLKVCYTQLAVTAASAYLEATTVNLVEYAGMNKGVQTALERTTVAFDIVADSRLAIQQSLGVIACRKETLLTQLNRHRKLAVKFRSVKYLHVVREFNAAADSLATETRDNKMSKAASTEARLSNLTALNRIQDVIYEPTAKAETEAKPSVNTANGLQERSVKTVMQLVRVYAEDPLQQDWDEIAEKLIFAINNSMDATTKGTLFYLVDGWDAQSTLRAMTSSLKRGFYPVVHVSRLKAVNEFGSRPKRRLTPEVTEETRLDFDEELLPKDSWEPDQLAGEYEVEAILDDRVSLSTSTEPAVREFKGKRLEYDEPTWEPASNLSCGGLRYDYLREKGSDRRLQMVQVADED